MTLVEALRVFLGPGGRDPREASQAAQVIRAFARRGFSAAYWEEFGEDATHGLLLRWWSRPGVSPDALPQTEAAARAYLKTALLRVKADIARGRHPNVSLQENKVPSSHEVAGEIAVRRARGILKDDSPFEEALRGVECAQDRQTAGDALFALRQDVFQRCVEALLGEGEPVSFSFDEGEDDSEDKQGPRLPDGDGDGCQETPDEKTVKKVPAALPDDDGDGCEETAGVRQGPPLHGHWLRNRPDPEEVAMRARALLARLGGAVANAYRARRTPRDRSEFAGRFLLLCRVVCGDADFEDAMRQATGRDLPARDSLEYKQLRNQVDQWFARVRRAVAEALAADGADRSEVVVLMDGLSVYAKCKRPGSGKVSDSGP